MVGKLCIVLSVFLVLFTLGGCSDVKDNVAGPPQTSALDVHPAGWLDPAGAEFHGKSLAKVAYDMSGCQGCHGEDYRGGIAQRACTECHQETPEGCNTCHGSATSVAPPADVAGNVATTARGVGAHQVHLSGGAMFDGMACEQCHQVPNALHATGHVDSELPAEVNITGLGAQNTTPVWNGESCSNTYCHGSATPNWTRVGSGEASCGTCHGAPPEAPHPQVENCSLCHSQVVDESGAIVDKTLHVNGTVEVAFGHSDGFASPTSENFHGLAIRQAGWSLVECQSCHGQDYGGSSVSDVSCLTCHPSTPEDCSVCHGDAINPAPPKDVDGHTATDFRGVGAHQAHLNGGFFAGAIDCSNCHSVPTNYRDPGHVDSDLPAEVMFGALATKGGLSPVWNGESCSNTYCHGSYEPKWTSVGTGESICSTCHGIPPALPHPQIVKCALCHPQTVDESLIIIDKTLHINGKVDFGP